MKKKILEFLTERREFVSGQEICEQLGVSRTAVWKYINSLRDEGYEIESVTRKGYRLLHSPDLLTGEELQKYLSKEIWPGPVACHASIDSTNEEAKRQAAQGAPDGSLYVADQQTAGKGRRGRRWISPGGEDIFFSLLLRPEIPVQCASMLTLVAALAAEAAVEKHSGETGQIKWPNDIILHDRKICGILTEMGTEMGEISYVVIGVGVNLNRMDFSENIAEIGSSIKKETGRTVKRAAFLADFLKEFQSRYPVFLREQDLRCFVEEYNQKLVNIGREVKIIKNKEEVIRTAEGINAQGELLVRREDGKQETVFTGEVSVRGLYGYV